MRADSRVSGKLATIIVALLLAAGTCPGEEAGWVSLFNGKDLSGWNVPSGLPGWVVENGELVCLGQRAGYLCSNEMYDDFELMLEYKVAPGGNSGVFLHASRIDPVDRGFEIQILDSYGKQDPDCHDAGAIYNFLTPCRETCRPAGEWNSIYARCLDRELVVVQNGVKVIDADLDEHPELARRPWRGRIMLQDHGSRVAFRNIRVRRLQAEMRPIFNGDNLQGWHVIGDPKSWIVLDGAIVCTGGSGGWIMTDRKYENFILSLEYQTEGNSGICIRAADQGDPAFSGMEIQVLQDSGEPPDIHGSMSIYGALIPAVNNTRPRDQWNRVVITCLGPRITVTQNGVKVHDFSVTDPALNALEMQARKLKDRVRTGYIGMQDHGSRVRYRNIRLKELPAGGW